MGVKLELELLNASGKKIDDVSDYRSTLGAGEIWKFRALAHDPTVVTGRLARIMEDN